MEVTPVYKCGTKLYNLKDNKLEEVVVEKVRIEVVLDENGVFDYEESYYLKPLLGARYWIDIAEINDRYFKSKEELKKSIFGE